MPQYLIERQLPENTNLSRRDLIAVATKFCRVLAGLGPTIRWHHSYYVGDRFYCVYSAPNEEMIHEHGARGGFPVTRISEISVVVDGSWARHKAPDEPVARAAVQPARFFSRTR